MHVIGLTLAAVCATIFVGLLLWTVVLAIKAAPAPAWRPRRPFPGWLMRRLVRWLRRRRYAAMASRISALELELGMREPTDLERGLRQLAEVAAGRLAAAERAAAHCLGGVVAYWTGEAADLQRRERRDHDATQCPTRIEVTRFTDSAPAYIHGIGCAPQFPAIPELPSFTPDPRLTARTNE